MIVTVDSTVLLHLIEPNLSVPPNQDGTVPDRCQERLDHLIDQLSKQGGRMIVPSPVLAEVLTKAGTAGPDWLATLKGRRSVRVADFDERAAIECAALAMSRAARRNKTPRPKAKFDEQIVAIAVVASTELILSDDSDIRSLAPSTIEVKGIGDLPLPPEEPQGEFELTPK